MITLTFPNTVAYFKNRPCADVRLNPSDPNSPTFKCIVDTGADYLQLPVAAVTQAGLSLSRAAPLQVTSATGTAHLLFLPGVDVEIEGKTVTQLACVAQSFQLLPTACRPRLVAQGI